MPLTAVVLSAMLIAACSRQIPTAPQLTTRWLAGDHHIHSRYSVLWNREVDPPEPILGSHGVYPMPLNAEMARRYGLSWMVATDHGGRNHSKLNLNEAYPNLVEAREAVPEVIQFYGVELNAPGADHVSVIIPHTNDEADQLYQLESRFDKRDADSSDPGADSEERMIEALAAMQRIPEKPVVIANHPSRTAMSGAAYGQTTPAELRNWNDFAPDIAVGMIGAPGHQAISLNPDGTIKPGGARGQYRTQRTLGGFDPMTARLGGFWDSMLGEGRRWWITANSDSHEHWTDGGVDFWPGEYSKTYVYAQKTHGEILESLRAGKVFVTTGDLVTELYVSVSFGSAEATIGGELTISSGSEVIVRIQARDPEGENARGDLPAVNRIDLIVGDVNGLLMDAAQDNNPSTRVVRRFSASDWTREGEFLTMTHRMVSVDRPAYFRVRGTNTAQLEPEPDPEGEDPWADLWFYSNPIFVELE